MQVGRVGGFRPGVDGLLLVGRVLRENLGEHALVCRARALCELGLGQGRRVLGLRTRKTCLLCLGAVLPENLGEDGLVRL